MTDLKGRLSVPGRPDSRIAHEQLLALAALAETAPLGDFIEVGVYLGGSAWHLYQITERRGCRLHLFDTFTGIPHKGDLDTHAVGDYGGVNLDNLKADLPNAAFYVGTFPKTLPANELQKIAFVHVDCDQYEGHRACINFLYPRLTHGGIMMFDDYPVLKGAKAAVEESFSKGQLMPILDRFYVVKP